jgi:DNA-binding MarR family transcriptional regulator
MNEQVRCINSLNRIIHEPGRLKIVAHLAGLKECDFIYLLNEIGMSKGNLSTHLTRLEAAGYIQIDKTYRGKTPLTVLRLTEAGHAAFKEYFQTLKTALNQGAGAG